MAPSSPALLFADILLDGPQVIVADRRWRAVVPQIERLVRRAVLVAPPEDWGAWPTVMLDRDQAVRVLNYRFRGRNKPTNVLTFEPSGSGQGGDIVLGFETVLREARAAGRPVRHHLAHLIVHGMLHLRGFDHHDAGEARCMEMHEARLLAILGVPNPWKMRALVRQDGRA